MKKSKKTVILYVLAVLFLITSFSLLFDGDVSGFFTCLIFSLALGFWGWRSSPKNANKTIKLVEDPIETIIKPIEATTESTIPVEENFTPVNESTDAVSKDSKSPSKIPIYTAPPQFAGYVLKYQYDDVDVAGASNYDLSELSVGYKLDIIPEPDNKYDNKAISFSYNDATVGYLHKNRLQDMAHDYLKRDGYIFAFVSFIDSSTLKINLSYYATELEEFEEKLNSNLPRKSFKLTGNTSASMQEDIWCCDIGDEVDFYYDYEKDKLAASSGCDLGYLSASAEEYIDNLDDYTAFIEDLPETNSGKISVKVVVFG